MANTAAARSVPQQLADVAERTVVTAAEAVGAVLLAKGSISFSAAEVAALGAVAGGLAAARALVANWLTGQRGPSKWLEDMSSRAIFTFAQTLIAALIVSAASGLDLSSVKAAAVSGAAAALAAIKGALARGVLSDPVFTPASLLPAPSGQSALSTTGQPAEPVDAAPVLPVDRGPARVG